VHRADRVVGDAEQARVREVDVHRRRRLGAGSELEAHVDAVDGLFLAGLEDVEGGREQRDRAQRGGLAQAGAELSFGAALQQCAVHVGGASAHRRAGEDVLGDRVVEEAVGGEDRHLAGLRVLRRQHTPGAAEVVDVAVGVDQTGDRAVAAVLAVEREGRRRGLGGDQRVDDDDALASLDHVHVREVEAAQLVEAGRQLEETGDAAELGLAPEIGVGRGGRFRVEEGVGLELPDHAAVRVLHSGRIEGGDEPSPCLLELLGRPSHA
jgi:hypothetical protein